MRRSKNYWNDERELWYWNMECGVSSRATVVVWSMLSQEKIDPLFCSNYV